MLDALIPAIPVPVLPESYDLSASYMELLMSCVNKLNAMIKLVNDETTALNEVKEQINQILPYLDDLAHMGERFEAMQAEIDTLRNELYDETDGDIVVIKQTLISLQATVNAAKATAELAISATMRTGQYAGMNALIEVSVPATQNAHGLTFTKDSATGWIHVTGTANISAQTVSVQLGVYKIKDEYKTIPFDGFDPDSDPIYKKQGNKFGALFYYSTHYIPTSYQALLVIGKDITTQDTLFSQSTMTAGSTTAANIYTDNNIEIKLYINGALDGQSLDFWVCPSIYPATITAWNYITDIYPLPLSPISNDELNEKITNETAARQTAISNEAAARASADAGLQASISQIDTRLTAETEMRLSEDQTLATQIDNEADARESADRTLQTNIDNLENDIPDTVISTVYGVGTTISATNDTPISLNDTTLPGEYICGASAAAYVTNQPNHGAATAGFRMSVAQMFTTAGRVRQTIRYNSTALAGKIFERVKYSNGWGSWYAYQGTVVPDPE